MTNPPPCNICTSAGTGTCLSNGTCHCYDGHIGITCQDPVTTASTTQVNAVAVIAGVLGGALFTLVVGLIVFFIWKRRQKKKKSFTFSATSSTTATVPSSELIVVPALYDLSITRRDSGGTVSYHLYDELP